MKRYILATGATIVLITGCGKKPQINEAYAKEYKETQYKVPKWYTQTHSNPFYLSATGEGNSLEDAKNNALNQIASSMSVEISSSFKKNEGYSTGLSESFYKKVDRSVNAKVDKVYFSNVELKKQEKIRTRYYCLVQIDKKKFYDSLHIKFMNLNESVMKKISLLDSYDSYTRIKKYHIISDEVTTLIGYANMLHTLNAVFDANGYLQTYNTFFTKKESFFNRFSFHILPENILYEKMIEAVNREGYKTSNASDISIRINDSLRYSHTFGMSVVKAEINVKLMNGSKTLISKNFSVKGFGSNKENARVKAADEFKKKLTTIGIDTLFKLK